MAVAVLAAVLLPVLLPGGRSPAEAGPRAARHAIQKALYAYGDAGKGDRWTGGDGTYSVPLPDGRTLWMFGDTFLGTVNRDRSRANQGFVHNSWVVQERNGKFGKTLVRTGGLFGYRAWENPSDDASWYWPGDATVVGKTLQHLLFRISGAGPAFGIIGVDLATYSWPGLELMSITQVPGGFLPSTQVGGGGAIAYGVSIMETADYTYIYGCEDWALRKYLHVARVKKGAALGTPWEYWDGKAWSTNPLASARIVDNVANEMSVVRTARGYRVIAQENGIGRDVYMYTATRPEGPWGGKTKIYTTPEDPAKFFTYNAKEHAQLGRPDRIVFSYNVNVQQGNDLYTNVDNYRPRFVEVYLRSDLPVRR